MGSSSAIHKLQRRRADTWKPGASIVLQKRAVKRASLCRIAGWPQSVPSAVARVAVAWVAAESTGVTLYEGVYHYHIPRDEGGPPPVGILDGGPMEGTDSRLVPPADPLPRRTTGARRQLRLPGAWCGGGEHDDLPGRFRRLRAAPLLADDVQLRPSPRLSVQAKAPRSRSTVASTSPPSRTRTQCRLPTSAYQTAPSASKQIPSGWSPGVAAQDARRRGSVGGDVVRRQLLAVGLRDDQGGAVRADGHAVGEGEPLGDHPRRAVDVDEGDQPGCELSTREVEADAVDVGVAAAVGHDVVPAAARDRRQVGVRDERAVGFAPQQPPPSAGETTSSRPSGRKSMHIGNDST